MSLDGLNPSPRFAAHESNCKPDKCVDTRPFVAIHNRSLITFAGATAQQLPHSP